MPLATGAFEIELKALLLVGFEVIVMELVEIGMVEGNGDIRWREKAEDRGKGDEKDGGAEEVGDKFVFMTGPSG